MATKRKTPAKAPAEKNKGGRPTRYRPEYDDQARKLCMLGYVDRKLADFFGVTEMTINEWKKRHPSFLIALRAGKEESDMEVVSALRQRATGYTYDDVHITAFQGAVTATPVVRHVPPDTAAAAFWLTNRQPDAWKAKRDTAPPPPPDTAPPEDYTLRPDEAGPDAPVL